MTPEREKALHELVDHVTKRVGEELAAIVKSCVHCEFFMEKYRGVDNADVCTNTINCPQSPARPPARIIAFGCPHFKDRTPF